MNIEDTKWKVYFILIAISYCNRQQLFGEGSVQDRFYITH